MDELTVELPVGRSEEVDDGRLNGQEMRCGLKAKRLLNVRSVRKRGTDDSAVYLYIMFYFIEFLTKIKIRKLNLKILFL